MNYQWKLKMFDSNENTLFCGPCFFKKKRFADDMLKFLTVGKNKVKRLLEFYKKCNPLCEDVVINEINLNQLPERS